RGSGERGSALEVPMAPFKKDLSVAKKGAVYKHKGKGSTQERLPSRHALNTITGGAPGDRNMNQYAKATPSIEEAGPSMGADGDQPTGSYPMQSSTLTPR